MKQKFFLCTKLPLLALVIISCAAGCASSERMVRLSGGVLSSYNVPHRNRIQSAKFKKIQSKNQDNLNENIADFDKVLVNFWPIFFRSGLYSTALWPIFDSDPYGFAFRPFFNQEGDDYSILFPLCAWNTHDRNGWCLNTYWNRNNDKFVFFPLIFCGKETKLFLPLAFTNKSETQSTTFITPFYIVHDKDKTKYYSSKSLPLKKHFWEVMLAYHDKEEYLDADFFYADFLYFLPNYPKKQTELSILMKKYGYDMPKDKTGLLNFEQEYFSKIKPKEKNTYGFYPFLSITKSPDESGFNFLLHLLSHSSQKNKSSNRYLFGLGKISSENYDQIKNFPFTQKESSHYFFPFYTTTKEIRHKNTPRTNAVSSLQMMANSRNVEFTPEQKAKITDLLQTIDPNAKLPDYVSNSDLLRLYFEDFIKTQTFDTYTYRSTWTLLFHGERNEYSYEWNSLPLLTFFHKDYRDSKLSTFDSLPLLSFTRNKWNSRTKYIATPLVYYEKNEWNDLENCVIHDANASLSNIQNSVAQNSLQSFLCYLFYRRNRDIIVAKPGKMTPSQISNLIHGLNNIQNEKITIQKNLSAPKLSSAQAQEELPKAQTNVERLRKELRVEELKEQTNKYLERNEKNMETFQKLIADFAKYDIQLDFNYEQITQENVQAFIQKFREDMTEIKNYKSCGSLFFWHTSETSDGNSEWSVLFNLASSNKTPKTEKTQVLHSFYRYTREGDKSEEIIFPFITIQRDGKNTKKSFCWRLWQRTEKDGQVGGYLFFIPYGNLKN